MICYHWLSRFKRSDSDFLVELYINDIGFVVNYEKDLPPIMKLLIPKSIMNELFPSFCKSVTGVSNEVILEAVIIDFLVKGEIATSELSEELLYAKSKIDKFISLFNEMRRDQVYLAYIDCNEES